MTIAGMPAALQKQHAQIAPMNAHTHLSDIQKITYNKKAHPES